jgi:hypothetical protein
MKRSESMIFAEALSLTLCQRFSGLLCFSLDELGHTHTGLPFLSITTRTVCFVLGNTNAWIALEPCEFISVFFHSVKIVVPAVGVITV